MTNTQRHAKTELELLSKIHLDPDNRPIVENFIPEILALCEKFGNSGKSGASAPYIAGAIASTIKKLLSFKPISPISGLDEEWGDVSDIAGGSEELYQNMRCGGILKHSKDGQASYVDAIVWRGQYPGDEESEKWDDTFTGRVCGYHSSQNIKSFPFTPKTFYVDVIREQLPDDWTEEPYIEGSDWYDSKEFEETGIKTWHKNNYRYYIKDQKQLDEVFEYYDRKD